MSSGMLEFLAESHFAPDAKQRLSERLSLLGLALLLLGEAIRKAAMVCRRLEPQAPCHVVFTVCCVLGELGRLRGLAKHYCSPDFTATMMTLERLPHDTPRHSLSLDAHKDTRFPWTLSRVLPAVPPAS